MGTCTPRLSRHLGWSRHLSNHLPLEINPRKFEYVQCKYPEDLLCRNVETMIADSKAFCGTCKIIIFQQVSHAKRSIFIIVHAIEFNWISTTDTSLLLKKEINAIIIFHILQGLKYCQYICLLSHAKLCNYI